MEKYNFNRLDDSFFYLFIFLAFSFCLIHAGRRSFRQPKPTEQIKEPIIVAEEFIPRHNLWQRIYHWTNATAISILFISGWMIYQPEGFFPSSHPPAYWFWWHQWGTAILLVSLLGHLIYEGLIVRALNPMGVNQKELSRLVEMIKNFLGISKSYPRSSKYHPAQIFFHWLVAGNVFLLILTGMVIWKPWRAFLPLSLLGLGWEFIFYNRLLHGFLSASLLGLLIGHIYFALFIKKNWPEAKSMITGQIKLRHYLEAHLLELSKPAPLPPNNARSPRSILRK